MNSNHVYGTLQREWRAKRDTLLILIFKYMTAFYNSSSDSSVVSSAPSPLL